MQKQGTRWHCLTMLVVLASCGLGGFRRCGGRQERCTQTVAAGDRQGVDRRRGRGRLASIKPEWRIPLSGKKRGRGHAGVSVLVVERRSAGKAARSWGGVWARPEQHEGDGR